METAIKHEKRIKAICKYIVEAVSGSANLSTLPAFTIDYVKPESHRCQCQLCSPELTAEIRAQLTGELRVEIRESIRQEVENQTTEAIRASCVQDLTDSIRSEL